MNEQSIVEGIIILVVAGAILGAGKVVWNGLISFIKTGWAAFKSLINSFNKWRKERAQLYWPSLGEDGASVRLEKTPLMLRLGLQFPQKWRYRIKQFFNRSK